MSAEASIIYPETKQSAATEGAKNPTHIPLTRIQKLIGERMSLSRRTKPCFSIESKADLTELMAVRPKLRKKFGVKITTNAFYIHALALAVREYPLAAGRLGGSPCGLKPA